ncbi:MAG TPA: sugar nucleotide-binding protein [Chitinophagaceae bacterium]|nr:sugar nucleotide-binding protein [Chitinophagaceae bacterium]
MMRILLTGANGFLGYYLSKQLLEREHEVVATGKGDCRLPFTKNKLFHYEPMDFTDPFAVHDVFDKYRPEMVVHAGAMSKVDACEQNQWEAYVTNVEGTVTMLLNAEEHKSFFVFVSTDFIFDGIKGMYNEDDIPGPVNFYGKTKLEAEESVKEYEFDWAIARTILVYGKPVSGKPNILGVVKEKLEKGEEYNVVDDQVRTPTFVEDLAAGIISIIEKKAKGIYHLSGEDVLTPYEMACKVADHLGLKRSLIKKVTAADFSQPAKRPPKTGFAIDKARKKLGFHPVSFEEGLKRTFS